MIKTTDLIFIVEDDHAYGRLLEINLKKQGFKNITFFQNEFDCLNSLHRNPKVIISDYYLRFMSGKKLIKKVKESVSGIYSILISGVFDNERYGNEMSIYHIDKYIVKDEKTIENLLNIMKQWSDPEIVQQFY